MEPTLAFDLTRLFIAPIQRTPRGIDRHDVGLATHFFREWRGDCFATLPTPFGVRCLSREGALRVLERAMANWGEVKNPEQEKLFIDVKDIILGGRNVRASPTRAKYPRPLHISMAVMKMIGHYGDTLGPRAISRLPRDTIYLNTGQVGIAIPRFLSWLDRRPDIKPVFMLHDTIPLDHAEYVPQNSPRFHQNMIDNAARYAAGLIVTTRAAEASIRRELRRSGREDILVFAEHAPVPTVFAQGPDPDPKLASVPYFVITGAIEPRKNHLLLLNVWRELVREQGASAPKLVVIGSRWRQTEAVASILERSTVLKDHVIEVAGLSSPGLRRLLSNASGLLMPSFAEGFGLPIVEALAVGTPVIASDLPAHIEAGGDNATYLSPIDGLGWLSAIRRHVEQQAVLRQRIANYKIWSWPDYLRRIDPFLILLDQSPDTRRSMTNGQSVPAIAAE